MSSSPSSSFLVFSMTSKARHKPEAKSPEFFMTWRCKRIFQLVCSGWVVRVQQTNQFLIEWPRAAMSCANKHFTIITCSCCPRFALMRSLARQTERSFEETKHERIKFCLLEVLYRTEEERRLLKEVQGCWGSKSSGCQSDVDFVKPTKGLKQKIGSGSFFV